MKKILLLCAAVCAMTIGGIRASILPPGVRLKNVSGSQLSITVPGMSFTLADEQVQELSRSKGTTTEYNVYVKDGSDKMPYTLTIPSDWWNNKWVTVNLKKPDCESKVVDRVSDPDNAKRNPTASR